MQIKNKMDENNIITEINKVTLKKNVIKDFDINKFKTTYEHNLNVEYYDDKRLFKSSAFKCNKCNKILILKYNFKEKNKLLHRNSELNITTKPGEKEIFIKKSIINDIGIVIINNTYKINNRNKKKKNTSVKKQFIKCRYCDNVIGDVYDSDIKGITEKYCIFIIKDYVKKLIPLIVPNIKELNKENQIKEKYKNNLYLDNKIVTTDILIHNYKTNKDIYNIKDINSLINTFDFSKKLDFIDKTIEEENTKLINSEKNFMSIETYNFSL